MAQPDASLATVDGWWKKSLELSTDSDDALLSLITKGFQTISIVLSQAADHELIDRYLDSLDMDRKCALQLEKQNVAQIQPQSTIHREKKDFDVVRYLSFGLVEVLQVTLHQLKGRNSGGEPASMRNDQLSIAYPQMDESFVQDFQIAGLSLLDDYGRTESIQEIPGSALPSPMYTPSEYSMNMSLPIHDIQIPTSPVSVLSPVLSPVRSIFGDDSMDAYRPNFDNQISTSPVPDISFFGDESMNAYLSILDNQIPASPVPVLSPIVSPVHSFFGEDSMDSMDAYLEHPHINRFSPHWTLEDESDLNVDLITPSISPEYGETDFSLAFSFPDNNGMTSNMVSGLGTISSHASDGLAQAAPPLVLIEDNSLNTIAEDSRETVEVEVAATVEARRRSSRKASRPARYLDDAEESGTDIAVDTRKSGVGSKKRSMSLKKPAEPKRGSGCGRKEQSLTRTQPKLNATELECPECEYHTRAVAGFVSHFPSRHNSTLRRKDLALRCNCGFETFSNRHKHTCRNEHFTVIHKVDSSVQKAHVGKAIPHNVIAKRDGCHGHAQGSDRGKATPHNMIAMRDGSRGQGADRGKVSTPNPQCVLCEAHPSTATAYAKHLYVKHRSSLKENDVFLRCSCGVKICSTGYRRNTSCKHHQFSLHKLEE